ncbi:MAG: MCE family protein [Gemmatimonadaceae bacterium]|nr:MCE family protein [Gemmatimonadaceae bacterium]
MRRRDEVLVGLFTTVAIVVLALASIWLVRGGLSRGYLLHSRFTWGAGVKQGAPVWLVGVTIGSVDNVELDPAGTLLVSYRIQSQYRVPLGTKAAIVPNGFFGDQAIALTPEAPNSRSFSPGDTIPIAVQGTGLQGLMQRADTLTAAIGAMLGALRVQMVDSGGFAEIRRTSIALNRLLNTAHQVADVQSRELQATLVVLRSRVAAVDSARVDSAVRSLQASAAHFETFTTELNAATARFNALLTKVESGEGSAAKLLNDPGLYNDLRAVAARVDSLLADLMRNPRKYLKFSVF